MFQVENAEFGPNDLLFLQVLIALITSVPSSVISSLSPLSVIGSHLKKCVCPALMC